MAFQVDWKAEGSWVMLAHRVTRQPDDYASFTKPGTEVSNLKFASRNCFIAL